MVFNYALYKNGLSDKDVIVDNSVDFASLSGAFIGGQGDFVNLFDDSAREGSHQVKNYMSNL